MWPAGAGRNVVPIRISDDDVPVAFERVSIGDAATARRRLLDRDLERQLADADIVPLEIHSIQPDRIPAESRVPRIDKLPGILLHRVLELWDGEADVEPLLRDAANETAADDRAVATVRRRLGTIRRSPAFERIVRGATVARELTVRFVDETGAVVEKRIDRLLRENGGEVVVDYKSGAPDRERLARDREQVGRYCRAVEAITGRPCGGLLWYIDGDRDDIVDVPRSEIRDSRFVEAPR